MSLDIPVSGVTKTPQLPKTSTVVDWTSKEIICILGSYVRTDEKLGLNIYQQGITKNVDGKILSTKNFGIGDIISCSEDGQVLGTFGSAKINISTLEVIKKNFSTNQYQ